MPLHIGIVGCSAEGAALCYRTICAEGAARLGGYAHPEVSMHTPSLAAYVDCLGRNDLEGVAELMLASARALQRAGADFLICPDNTIHQAFAFVASRSPLPWLHIGAVVAKAAEAHGYARVGLTGTSWLVDSAVYPEQLDAVGVACLRPSDANRDAINRIIMDELVHGVVAPESIARFQSVLALFATQGCDAVILGCTELPLLVAGVPSPLPTLDSTRLLARAALDRALELAE
jgi:aspartate racemase